jgi:hypothetical protein
MALARSDHRTIARTDALAAPADFQVEDAIQADQHLEVVMAVAARGSAVGAQRQEVLRVTHRYITPAAWACWSAW